MVPLFFNAWIELSIILTPLTLTIGLGHLICDGVKSRVPSPAAKMMAHCIVSMTEVLLNQFPCSILIVFCVACDEGGVFSKFHSQIVLEFTPV